MSELLLVGSPNSGKSLLFNRLTGLSQKVANFPGITVDVARGKLKALADVTLVDFPGTYSLQAISGEEKVASDTLLQTLDDEGVRGVLCIVDITRLEKSLYFALQVIRECKRRGKPVWVLANMTDVLAQHGIAVDVDGLAREIKAPVLPVSGRTGAGLDALISAVESTPQTPVKEMDGEPDALLRSEAQRISAAYGPRGELLIKTDTQLDALFLHTSLGGLAFFAIMYLLFQSIFTWAAPAMDAVEAGLGSLADLLVPLIGNRVAQDFTSDAIFSGLGAFLVFVPQIFVLTLVIGVLEDSGYMARAAVICHKPLRFFGLTGKSFIPMLSGVACAIPGIYAARSVDSPKKRLLTYMAIPLMPCSARLPVYTLLIAAFIPDTTYLGGLVGLQGLAMFFTYFFGMLAGLIVTGLVSRTREDRYTDLPFVLEMPPYRLPSWLPLLRNSWTRSKQFVTKAGAIIFSVTVIIWFLGYFPNYGEDLSASWLGSIGQLIEPLFAPLGLDWRYGVAVMTSFLAREVFVGTLGAMFGIEGADENMVPLVTQIQSSELGIASGVALLFFFAIALMCVSTLAVLGREARSWKLPVLMFFAYCSVAYLGALLIYQGVSLIGG
ncbi:MAG: ferrous iron transporter B [Pseudomonadota bacterium]